AVQVLGQRDDGDDRSIGGGGSCGSIQAHGVSCVGRLVVRAFDFPDRFSQQGGGSVAMGLLVFLLQTGGADHHEPAGSGPAVGSLSSLRYVFSLFFASESLCRKRARRGEDTGTCLAFRATGVGMECGGKRSATPLWLLGPWERAVTFGSGSGARAKA